MSLLSLPNIRRVVFVTLVSWLSLELFTCLFCGATGRKIFSRPVFHETLKAETGQSEQQFILHPYLGFTWSQESGANRYGFAGPEPVLKRSKDSAIVVITGGSVAFSFYYWGQKSFIKKLKRIPAFSNKKIKLLCLAVPGYKQPQQLLALNYFLSMGAEFDLILNLDGFNEAVLPYSENYQNEIALIYPRGWGYYGRQIDGEAAFLILKIKNLKALRETYRRFFSCPPFRWSPFSLVLWNGLDHRAEIGMRSSQACLEKPLSDSKAPSPQISGPAVLFKGKEDLWKEEVKVWAESSWQMAKISEANQMKYIHFLQPNQHFSGSKILSAEEARMMKENENLLAAEAVRQVYPLMIETGNHLLKSEGVRFHDLSGIFKNEPETVYTDDCCHFNFKGNEGLADAIADAVRRQYAAAGNSGL